MSRALAAAAIATFLVAAPAGTVAADPAGPTDFRTTVVSMTPAIDGIDVEVIGGDSFLQLTVAPGLDVVVLGYQQEPYLHFRSDGIVEENERSPAAYLNVDRYGGGEIPAGADPALPPNWRQVGSGGRHAWHDHRAHWMDQNPPANGVPGTQIQSATVPLLVDGVPVEVAVRTDWLPEPSRVPLAVGAAVGLALVLLTVLLRRRLAWALLAVAAAATVIGWWQYRRCRRRPTHGCCGGCCRCSPPRASSSPSCSGGGWSRSPSCCSPHYNWRSGCSSVATARSGRSSRPTRRSGSTVV